MVDLFLNTVAETVDGVEVWLLVACKPYKVYVSLQGGLYLATRIKVVHLAVDDCLQHHHGVVGTASAFFVQFLEIVEPEIVYDSMNYAHRIVFRDIFVETLRKKNHLFGIVIPKV